MAATPKQGLELRTINVKSPLDGTQTVELKHVMFIGDVRGAVLYTVNVGKVRW